MIYSLRPADRQLVEEIAQARTRANFERTGQNKHYAPGNHLDVERTGAAGEVAFSRVFGYPVDVDKKPDQGWDFCLQGNKAWPELTLDVKTRREGTSCCHDLALNQPDPRKMPAEFYLAACVDVLDVDLVGWLTRFDFRTRGHAEVISSKVTDAGTRWLVWERLLRPTEELLWFVELLRDKL